MGMYTYVYHIQFVYKGLKEQLQLFIEDHLADKSVHTACLH
jgi:hypothetical protein